MILSNELQLPEFEIYNKTEKDGVLYYSVTPVETPKRCPHCGSTMIVKNGSVDRFVRDLPIYGKPVAITISTNRYKCRACEQSFTPSFESVDDRGKITKRMKDAIKAKCLQTGMTALADDMGLSTATIERIISECIKEKEADWTYYVPKILGLAEAVIGKKSRLICVDIERSGVVDVLEDNSSQTLRKFLEPALKDEQTHSFVIDFNEGYRDLIKEMFPKSSVYIDQFFVARDILSATNADIGRIGNSELRNTILKNSDKLSDEEERALEKLFRKDQRLRDLYEAKEQLLSMYDYDAKETADLAFEEARRVTPRDCKNMQALLQKIRKFREEVTGFIAAKDDMKSCIPSEVKLAKQVEKNGAGYKFENLRARLLFGNFKKEARAKIVKPVYKQPKHDSSTFYVFTPHSWRGELVGYEEVEETLGNYVDIDMILEHFL